VVELGITSQVGSVGAGESDLPSGPKRFSLIISNFGGGFEASFSVRSLRLPFLESGVSQLVASCSSAKACIKDRLAVLRGVLSLDPSSGGLTFELVTLGIFSIGQE
jgi:hypothetical protein